MRTWSAIAALAAFFSLHLPVSAEGQTTALFQSNELLTVTIEGPIKEIARLAEQSTDPHLGVLIANGETHQIQLSARGNSRRQRDKCTFPPLRVSFTNRPGPSSLFAKQGGIKLVTHCKDNDRYEQLAAREYTTYRLYNLVTPQSLKVRPLRVNYVDRDKRVAERFGFFIEDIDDAARRLDAKEIDVVSVSSTAIDQSMAARYSLFQYMIGNTDWDMAMGPPGSDCCHNSKLIGRDKDASSGLLPIPYDFDNAGLVGAPYAVPADILTIRSVKQRYYRGYCAQNAFIRNLATEFAEMHATFNTEILSSAHLNGSSKQNMTKYLDEFFELISHPDEIDRKILKTCR